MTRMKTMLMTAIGVTAIGASALAIANPPMPSTDLEAAKAIQKAQVPLHEAVKHAEKRVSGKAINARFAESADQPAYIIDVVDMNGKIQVVRVTADAGKVTGVWPKPAHQGSAAQYQEPR